MLIVCTWLRRVGGQRPWRLLKTESMGSNIGTGHLLLIYSQSLCLWGEDNARLGRFVIWIKSIFINPCWRISKQLSAGLQSATLEVQYTKRSIIYKKSVCYINNVGRQYTILLWIWIPHYYCLGFRNYL